MRFVLVARLAMVLAVAAGLGACAGVPDSAVLHPVAEKAGLGQPVSVLAATTRQRSAADPRDFTSEREFGLSYDAYRVSVPPVHVPGEIEWPARLPGDPAKSFVVTGSQRLDQAGFARDVTRDMKGSGEVIVFVHGYNTSYQEAVFRAAQLKHDNEIREAMVAFSWPSAAAVTGYLADREASTYSRDYLERTLDGLARMPGVKRIHIIAHSMGGWLTMETLRQATLRGRSAFLPKLGEVFLASPDIDVYVFRTQLDVIGRRTPPITVAISDDDQALGLSQWLAGDVPRVGNIPADLTDAEEARKTIARYGLRVINMTKAKGADPVNHSKFVGLLPTLSRMMRDETRSRSGLLSRTGIFAVDVAGGILQVPFRVGEAIAGR